MQLTSRASDHLPVCACPVSSSSVNSADPVCRNVFQGGTNTSGDGHSGCHPLRYHTFTSDHNGEAVCVLFTAEKLH